MYYAYPNKTKTFVTLTPSDGDHHTTVYNVSDILER